MSTTHTVPGVRILLVNVVSGAKGRIAQTRFVVVVSISSFSIATMMLVEDVRSN